MMTIHKFVDAVLTLQAEFDFSVSSWFRTKKRNKGVGGNAESFHLCGLGADCVLDLPDDQDLLVKRARRLGLDAIVEGDHIHLEPSG